jgi:hypothetical protein
MFTPESIRFLPGVSGLQEVEGAWLKEQSTQAKQKGLDAAHVLDCTILVLGEACLF